MILSFYDAGVAIGDRLGILLTSLLQFGKSLLQLSYFSHGHTALAGHGNDLRLTKTIVLGTLQHLLKLCIRKHVDFYLADIGEGLCEESGRSYDKKEEEKKEETKKEEEKKEEEKKKKEEEKKKKQEVTNPLLLASDIAGAESADGKYLLSVSLGVSKSSLAGDVSYSAGLVVNSDLSSIVTTGGITKMEMKPDGNLNAIHSYGTAFAYLGGNYMNLMGYTWIKPTPKRGTYGYNVGLINLFLKNDDGGFTYNMASSLIVFWTKPYIMNKKLVVSPQVFTTFAPLAWNSVTKVSTVNRHMGFLVGAAFDYKISKRFGFSFNYKVSSNTASGTPFLSNFLVGSRMML